MTILAATGHRPDKLGGYGPDVFESLVNLATGYFVLAKSAGAAPDGVISGMALGWDMAWAEAAYRSGLPFVAAVPFEGQERLWPDSSKRQHADLLKRAAQVVVVCPGGYDPQKMQTRNRWMVDHADGLVALWDGSSGGTANCVKYAQRIGRPVVNLWSAYR